MNVGKPYRPLTQAEQQALASYEKKCAIVRDKVRAAVFGNKLGCIIWGEGGIGKSFQVETILRQARKEGITCITTNSRMSARGLVDITQKHHDAIHSLEDIESLFETKAAFGFLRSLLWGQKDEKGVMRRFGTWEIHQGSKDEGIRFEFTGKLIVTANCPLDDLPELRALATRIPPYRFRASRDELLALMKKMCNEGYRYQGVALTPQQCFEVYDYYLSNVPEKRSHDIRILEHGFWNRINEIKSVLKETNWQEQFLAEILKGEDPPVTRKVRIRNEREIALELYGLYEESKITHAEMHGRWEELTGHASLDSLYRRLRGK
jgi:hypothetical protein